MKSKTIRESGAQRIYHTEKGAAVSCVIQHQPEYDPDDGQQAGYYGWCGLVDDQSDYMIGPYSSAPEVFAAYEKRNPKHTRMGSVTLYQTRAPEFKARLSVLPGGKS